MSVQVSEADQKWRKVLVEGHPALTISHRIFATFLVHPAARCVITPSAAWAENSSDC